MEERRTYENENYDLICLYSFQVVIVLYSH